MVEGITKSGFKFSIPKETFDDWDLLEHLRYLDEEPHRCIDVARKLLDEKQYDALKKHCTDKKKNIVKASLMSVEITDILQCSEKLKN